MKVLRGESALWHCNVRRILDFVVEHGVVWLLGVADELVNVLVNLNRSRNPAIAVLELNVVLPWLLIHCLDLDGGAGTFNNFGRLLCNVIFLTSLGGATLSLIDIDVEVLDRGHSVVPSTAVKILGLVALCADFLLKLVDALLVLVSLITSVS